MATYAFRLLVVLLLAILLSVQCIASCGTAGVSPSANNLPPCHRNHQGPVQQTQPPCCHESVLTATDQPWLEHPVISIAVVPVSAIPLIQTNVNEHLAPSPLASPPDPDLSRSAVLRV